MVRRNSSTVRSVIARACASLGRKPAGASPSSISSCSRSQHQRLTGLIVQVAAEAPPFLFLGAARLGLQAPHLALHAGPLDCLVAARARRVQHRQLARQPRDRASQSPVAEVPHRGSGKTSRMHARRASRDRRSVARPGSRVDVQRVGQFAAGGASSRCSRPDCAPKVRVRIATSRASRSSRSPASASAWYRPKNACDSASRTW